MDDRTVGLKAPLPTIEQVEIPSITLIDRAYHRSTKLHTTLCRKDMFRIWNRLGAAVCGTTLEGTGVRFPGSVDLSFDVKGAPMSRRRPRAAPADVGHTGTRWRRT